MDKEFSDFPVDDWHYIDFSVGSLAALKAGFFRFRRRRMDDYPFKRVFPKPSGRTVSGEIFGEVE